MTFKGSIMVVGPRPQFNPTTSAPASSNRLQASSMGTPSCIFIDIGSDSVITDGKPGNGLRCIFFLLQNAYLNTFKKVKFYGYCILCNRFSLWGLMFVGIQKSIGLKGHNFVNS